MRSSVVGEVAFVAVGRWGPKYLLSPTNARLKTIAMMRLTITGTYGLTTGYLWGRG